MYLKKPDHNKRIIKDLYTVWLPPIPPRDTIAGWGLKKKDQMWRRTPLPSFYDERRLEEIDKQEAEEKLVEDKVLKCVKHFDPVLENYRRQEWMRRIYGYWFMNNGVPTYLTGQHYMYLQWSKLDHPENDSYPVFYAPQLDRFYFRQLCWEDPFCLGYLLVGPRGFGKTSEEAAAQLENITKPPHTRHAAIQSKTEDDATDVVFKEKMVNIFNSYPDFFKPRHSHSTDPSNRMVFKRKAINKEETKKKMKFGPDEELGNTVKVFSAKEKAADGKTLTDIISDEIGKTDPKTEADVYKRNAVHVKSVFRNQVKRGLIRATTTIEEMDKGGDECYEIWKESDPRERDPNGYTKSKLYKYLVTGIETQSNLADQYGNIPEAEGRKQVENERAPFLEDPYKLSIVMRKNPLNEEEAFIKDQTKCLFNILIISKRMGQLGALSPPNRPGRQGRFEWKHNIVDGDVEWIDDESGPFRLFYSPDAVLNKSRKILNACDYMMADDGKKKIWLPCNNDIFRAGSDPIKFIQTDDARASKMAAFGFFKYFPDFDNGKENVMEWLSHCLMWKYHNRDEDPEEDFENIIKAMRYFGHSIMPENNVSDFTKHLYGRGYHRFIIVRRNFDPSVLNQKSTRNSLGQDQAVQSVKEVINTYIKKIKQNINRHGMRIPDLDLLRQLRDFDSKKPTKFDLVVAFGYTLMALEADLEDDTSQKTYEMIENYFSKYDISGNRSVEIPQNNPKKDFDRDEEEPPFDWENPHEVMSLLSGK